ncbi:AMIN-like domain-containing (lipo)protein [Sinomonas mesophila]|uniref:AMIN-like domain-containing (lipo)protein n=1 Tax=Sinomonas mesophila TaxID=1531955 RepID=UPI0009859304
MTTKVPGVLAALALTAGLGLVVPGTASAAPFCGITWGSLAKSTATLALGPSQDPITNIRSGRHACFDRLVVDVNGEAPKYTVRYVSAVTLDGSGFTLPLRGGAFIEVTVMAPAHDQDYNPTYTPANRDEAVNVAGFQTFRQVAFAGTYEFVTEIGLGVRARLPFRVFTLAGPGAGSRLVIDVAHRW